MSGRWRRNAEAIPLLAPAVIVTAALIVFPIGYAIALSVSNWSPSGSLGGFAGLSHYTHMLAHDPLFWKSLRITMLLFIACLVVQTVLGLLLGYLLSIDVPGRSVFQALVLIPSIVASVAVGLLWELIYDPTLGIANWLLGAVGLGQPAWLGDPHVVLWAFIILDTWQWAPFMALIMAAGIRSLPAEPLEAARVDGAGGWQTAWRVGLPLLRPVIMVAVLLRSVDLIRFFDTIYVMTQGGPVDSSTTLNIYGYETGFINLDMSYAATLQIALMVIVIAIAGLITWMRRRVA
ncbi:MAG TPA: sugar ABC transporter permease [Mycobacteriales bacterium]|nr:sugar ABC transporter permease [Mycobacteriales bacterium]